MKRDWLFVGREPQQGDRCFHRETHEDLGICVSTHDAGTLCCFGKRPNERCFQVWKIYTTDKDE